MPDRDELYSRIQASLVQAILNYYIEYPDRRLDGRSVAGIAAAWCGVKELLSILEEYEITKRKP